MATSSNINLLNFPAETLTYILHCADNPAAPQVCKIFRDIIYQSQAISRDQVRRVAPYLRTGAPHTASAVCCDKERKSYRFPTGEVVLSDCVPIEWFKFIVLQLINNGAARPAKIPHTLNELKALEKQAMAAQALNGIWQELFSRRDNNSFVASVEEKLGYARSAAEWGVLQSHDSWKRNRYTALESAWIQHWVNNPENLPIIQRVEEIYCGCCYKIDVVPTELYLFSSVQQLVLCRQQITHVEIPVTLTALRVLAIRDNEKLTHVEIPDSLTALQELEIQNNELICFFRKKFDLRSFRIDRAAFEGYICHTKFASFYKNIAQRVLSTKEIEQELMQLDPIMRNQIYGLLHEIICKQEGRLLSRDDESAIENTLVFYKLVNRSAIYTYNQLTVEQKNAVHLQAYRLAEQQMPQVIDATKSPLECGKDIAKAYILLLIEAMEMEGYCVFLPSTSIEKLGF